MALLFWAEPQKGCIWFIAGGNVLLVAQGPTIDGR